MKIEDAYKEFIQRLQLILAVIVITIIGYVISIFVDTTPFSLISNFIVGLTLSYSVIASLAGYLYSPRFSDQIDKIREYFPQSTALGLILGLFFLAFSYLSIRIGPLTFLLDGLALAFDVILSPLIFRGISFPKVIREIQVGIKSDFLSFVILYVLSLLSLLPLIDILAIPLDAILSYLLLKEFYPFI
ncbi:hypothetical protein [Acidianus sp. HS-5]|uniref:hypothetical protein n=1 Tax=Acidianus sp. HS-5 TaxID=2886040 RepID=UPI001F21A01D|nr:hypothetical protein [Acidianus sp. HS-5]BDC18057.1 hypothetical protein HS5_09470 [Acidianus sp. HS-5]